jgi:hypothetical protein
MKRILNAIKWGWTVYRRPEVFQDSAVELLEKQLDFLKEVAESNQPRITHLGFVHTEQTGAYNDIRILTLWCSTGNHTVMERVEELAVENARLRETINTLLNARRN